MAFAKTMDLDDTKHTLYPTCTGTTVIGIVFKGGVMLACDRLVSYGKMARFGGYSRIYKVNNNTMVAFGGDHADFQNIKNMIEVKMCEYKSECNDPDAELSPKAIHSWLTWLLYYRRSRIDPLYNTLVVIGMQGKDKEPFMGVVNLRGVAYDPQYMATGLGAMLLQQTLENRFRECSNENKEIQMDKEQASDLMKKCIDLVFYRDCVATNEFDITCVTADGIEMSKPEKTTGNWEVAEEVIGYE